MNEEKIVFVEELEGEGNTYDLEIDHSSHTFFANDISVSNSHSVAYSILSFQCAHLMNYYPIQWCAAFLNREPEDKKEKAIKIGRASCRERV
jgi:DNA polymerase III alpha subunit